MTDPSDRTADAHYHLDIRIGSRRTGACAALHYDYITRGGTYQQPERDPAIFIESDHLPEWAGGEPRRFWDAADLYENAAARLYVGAEYALPRALKAHERIEVARGFAHELTSHERFPYTLAVHAGLDARGDAHNPHAHLMISERGNDGIARTRHTWFRRANERNVTRGGAPKSVTFQTYGWIEQTRQRLADRLNAALERAGRAERVDHRSYARRGLDRVPELRIWPSSAHVVDRVGPPEHLIEAALAKDDLDRLAALEQEIAALEVERGGLTHLLDRLEQGVRDRADGARHVPSPARRR